MQEESLPILKEKVPLSIWRRLWHCVLYSVASIVAFSSIYACFIICEKGIVWLLQWSFSEPSGYAILFLNATYVMSGALGLASYVILAVYSVYHVCKLCLRLPKEDE